MPSYSGLFALVRFVSFRFFFSSLISHGFVLVRRNGLPEKTNTKLVRRLMEWRRQF
jgi:hypothetical protein